MRFILNSAVITTPGNYSYELITVEQAKWWINKGEFLSTIGYQETADALSKVLGINIPLNRKNIKMELGDEALVFRLTARMNDPELKGKIGSIDFIIANCEIGILKKL